jgi:hypothetical protein
MRRLLALTFAALCSLAVLPAAAPAKEISKVAVCGQGHQCVTYDKSDLGNLMFLAEDAGPTDPPAAAAPWFRVRYTVDMRAEGGGRESWSVAYVPSAGSLRLRDDTTRFAWVALTPRSARMLERDTRDLQAFPKTTLRGLHPKQLEARVDEVYAPAADHAAAPSTATPWGWIATAAIGAVLLLILAARTVRRRRRIEVAPT